jgi:hypothetical protein
MDITQGGTLSFLWVNKYSWIIKLRLHTLLWLKKAENAYKILVGEAPG